MGFYESLVLPFLDKYLKKYIKGFEPSEITKTKEWVNLSLKEAPIEALGLPICLKQGRIEALHIDIPVWKLGTAPVNFRLKGLTLVLAPRHRDQLSSTLAKQLLLDAKQRRLWIVSLLGLDGSTVENTAAFSNSYSRRIIDSLWHAVAPSIHINIESVHIRYEDDYSSPEAPFALGFRIDKIFCEGSLSSVSSTGIRANNISISNAYIYLQDTLSPEAESSGTTSNFEENAKISPRTPTFTETRLLHAPLINIGISTLSDSAISETAPLFDVCIDSGIISSSVTPSQLQRLLNLYSYMSTLLRLAESTAISPVQQESRLPEAHFAKNATSTLWSRISSKVLEIVLTKRATYSWDFISQRKARLKQYKELFTRFIRIQENSSSDVQSLAALESALSFDDIIACRRVAYAASSTHNRTDTQSPSTADSPALDTLYDVDFGFTALNFSENKGILDKMRLRLSFTNKELVCAVKKAASHNDTAAPLALLRIGDFSFSYMYFYSFSTSSSLRIGSLELTEAISSSANSRPIISRFSTPSDGGPSSPLPVLTIDTHVSANTSGSATRTPTTSAVKISGISLVFAPAFFNSLLPASLGSEQHQYWVSHLLRSLSSIFITTPFAVLTDSSAAGFSSPPPSSASHSIRLRSAKLILPSSVNGKATKSDTIISIGQLQLRRNVCPDLNTIPALLSELRLSGSSSTLTPTDTSILSLYNVASLTLSNIAIDVSKPSKKKSQPSSSFTVFCCSNISFMHLIRPISSEKSAEQRTVLQISPLAVNLVPKAATSLAASFSHFYQVWALQRRDIQRIYPVVTLRPMHHLPPWKRRIESLSQFVYALPESVFGRPYSHLEDQRLLLVADGKQVESRMLLVIEDVTCRLESGAPSNPSNPVLSASFSTGTITSSWHISDSAEIQWDASVQRPAIQVKTSSTTNLALLDCAGPDQLPFASVSYVGCVAAKPQADTDNKATTKLGNIHLNLEANVLLGLTRITSESLEPLLDLHQRVCVSSTMTPYIPVAFLYGTLPTGREQQVEPSSTVSSAPGANNPFCLDSTWSLDTFSLQLFSSNQYPFFKFETAQAEINNKWLADGARSFSTRVESVSASRLDASHVDLSRPDFHSKSKYWQSVLSFSGPSLVLTGTISPSNCAFDCTIGGLKLVVLWTLASELLLFSEKIRATTFLYRYYTACSRILEIKRHVWNGNITMAPCCLLFPVSLSGKKTSQVSIGFESLALSSIAQPTGDKENIDVAFGGCSMSAVFFDGDTRIERQIVEKFDSTGTGFRSICQDPTSSSSKLTLEFALKNLKGALVCTELHYLTEIVATNVFSSCHVIVVPADLVVATLHSWKNISKHLALQPSFGALQPYGDFAIDITYSFEQLQGTLYSEFQDARQLPLLQANIDAASANLSCSPSTLSGEYLGTLQGVKVWDARGESNKYHHKQVAYVESSKLRIERISPRQSQSSLGFTSISLHASDPRLYILPDLAPAFLHAVLEAFQPLAPPFGAYLSDVLFAQRSPSPDPLAAVLSVLSPSLADFAIDTAAIDLINAVDHHRRLLSKSIASSQLAQGDLQILRRQQCSERESLVNRLLQHLTQPNTVYSPMMAAQRGHPIVQFRFEVQRPEMQFVVAPARKTSALVVASVDHVLLKAQYQHGTITITSDLENIGISMGHMHYRKGAEAKNMNWIIPPFDLRGPSTLMTSSPARMTSDFIIPRIQTIFSLRDLIGGLKVLLAYKPSFLKGFEIVNALLEAIELRRSQHSEVNSTSNDQPSVPRFVMNVLVKRIDSVVLNDFRQDCVLPMFNSLLLPVEIAIVSDRELSAGFYVPHLSIGTFNARTACYEPFVEPWSVRGTFHFPITSPDIKFMLESTERTMHVNFTRSIFEAMATFFPFFNETRYLLLAILGVLPYDLAAAFPQRTPTATLQETLIQTISPQNRDSKERMANNRVEAYRVACNDMHCPIQVWPSTSLPFDGVELQIGETWLVPQDKEVFDASPKLNIRVRLEEGSSFVLKALSFDSMQSRIYSTKVKGNLHQLLVEVTSNKGRLEMSVSTISSLRNSTTLDAEATLCAPDLPPLTMLLASKRITSIPSPYAKWSTISLRPVGNEYMPCAPLKRPAHEDAPFVLCAPTVPHSPSWSAHLCCEEQHRASGTVRRYTLGPVLVVKNSLPLALKWGSTSISSQRSADIFHPDSSSVALRSQASHNLVVDGYQPLVLGPVDDLLAKYHEDRENPPTCTVRHDDGRNIIISFSTLVSQGTVFVTVFSKYVVVNDTGLALSSRKQGRFPSLALPTGNDAVVDVTQPLSQWFPDGFDALQAGAPLLYSPTDLSLRVGSEDAASSSWSSDHDISLSDDRLFHTTSQTLEVVDSTLDRRYIFTATTARLRNENWRTNEIRIRHGLILLNRTPHTVICNQQGVSANLAISLQPNERVPFHWMSAKAVPRLLFAFGDNVATPEDWSMPLSLTESMTTVFKTQVQDEDEDGSTKTRLCRVTIAAHEFSTYIVFSDSPLDCAPEYVLENNTTYAFTVEQKDTNIGASRLAPNEVSAPWFWPDPLKPLKARRLLLSLSEADGASPKSSKPAKIAIDLDGASIKNDKKSAQLGEWRAPNDQVFLLSLKKEGPLKVLVISRKDEQNKGSTDPEPEAAVQPRRAFVIELAIRAIGASFVDTFYSERAPSELMYATIERVLITTRSSANRHSFSMQVRSFQTDNQALEAHQLVVVSGPPSSVPPNLWLSVSCDFDLTGSNYLYIPNVSTNVTMVDARADQPFLLALVGFAGSVLNILKDHFLLNTEPLRIPDKTCFAPPIFVIDSIRLDPFALVLTLWRGKRLNPVSWLGNTLVSLGSFGTAFTLLKGSPKDLTDAITIITSEKRMKGLTDLLLTFSYVDRTTLDLQAFEWSNFHAPVENLILKFVLHYHDQIFSHLANMMLNYLKPKWFASADTRPRRRLPRVLHADHHVTHNYDITKAYGQHLLLNGVPSKFGVEGYRCHVWLGSASLPRLLLVSNSTVILANEEGKIAWNEKLGSLRSIVTAENQFVATLLFMQPSPQRPLERPLGALSPDQFFYFINLMRRALNVAITTAANPAKDEAS